jgi:lambda family phage tail tape measure protein
MAANLNYNVNVNTTAGVQALTNLQNKVAGVSNAFGGLKNAIGGIAVGAAITSILRFADGIQDLSDATGIASANILGFQKAVQAFGGSADGADKAILKLVQNIGEANSGSADLQLAFDKVGVSLDDLRNLSEQDILAKTLVGLEKIQDKSLQASLKAQLLSKEMRGVASSGLPEAFAKATAESEKNAESIRRVAELQGNLEKAIGKVKLVLLEMIEPMAKFINSMDQERVGQLIESLTKLGVALLALSALSATTAAIKALQVAFGGLLATTFGLILNVLKFGTIIGRVLTGVGAAAIALATIFPETAAKINKAFGEATDAVKEFIGIDSPKFLDQSEVDRENYLLKQRSEALKQNGQAAREQIDPFKSLKETLSGTANEYARINKENIKNIELATKLVGLTSQEADIHRANAELVKRETEEIKKLEDQKNKLTEAQQKAGIGGIIDAQIAKIKEQTKEDQVSTEQAIKNLEARKNAHEALKAIQDFAYKSEIDGIRKVQDVMDDMNKNTMNGLQKAYADIETSSRKSAEAAIDAENSRRRSAGLAAMTADETKRYYDEANKGNAQLKRATEESYNNSRRFSTGWKKAFNEYADNATDAAKQAENLFKKATQGMEDVIVKFAKTGKFEWKGFVNDMLEQLLRSQIQSTFASILGGITGSMGKSGGGAGGGGGGGGGGILDSIAGLFGGGGGGAPGSSANNPMYVFDISGGGGGGGFMGPMQQPGQEGGGLGGIWESVKGIGSSIWDGVSGAVGGIVDGISGAFGGIADAVGGLFGGGGGGDSGGGFFDSIGSLFDGFFANGGQIGAGKFGVVGENGPELVSGPANVAPMGGGSTSVTYNINAVDAMSFKQMLAQDPSFIYGLSMQGAKGVPARR